MRIPSFPCLLLSLFALSACQKASPEAVSTAVAWIMGAGTDLTFV